METVDNIRVSFLEMLAEYFGHVGMPVFHAPPVAADVHPEVDSANTKAVDFFERLTPRPCSVAKGWVEREHVDIMSTTLQFFPDVEHVLLSAGEVVRRELVDDESDAQGPVTIPVPQRRSNSAS